ncbi:ChaN family lipoprotein [Campylobacter geochelonis]|uniref:ChaN family lipoprotein n=1 Tax=Campylobacter geochelonis TaxID=1780362 RepID=UPI000770B818|nr:ChaN family lipoprotein [Campylobacter geochelonis]CZE50287.1 chain X [Campylobacter geochelonis]
MKKFITLLFLLIFTGCAINEPLRNRTLNDEKIAIIDTKTNKSIPYSTFIDKIQKHNIILLGEYHEIPNHMAMEVRIFKSLNELQNLDVVFEMLSSDKQAKINEAKAKQILPNELKNAIDWDEKWDYRNYGELVESVFYSNSNLIAGNLSKDEINTIFNGALPIYGKFSTADEIKKALKTFVATSHKLENDEKNSALLDKFVQVQLYKDRRMADKLVHSKTKSLLIAGQIHASKTVGVYNHILDFDLKKSVVSVMLGDEKSFDLLNAQSAIKAFCDYYIVFK